MKKVFRHLSILLAMVVAFSAMPTIQAFAAGPGSITINKPANLSLEDQVFSAYKIFDVTYSGTNYSYTLADPDFTGLPAYLLTNPDGYTAYSVYITANPTKTIVDFIGQMLSNSKELDAFASEVWKYIVDKGLSAEGHEDGTAADSVVIDNLAEGYYLVYGTGVKPVLNPNYDPEDPDSPKYIPGDEVVVAACALTTTNPDVEITLKADAPKIDKEVYNQHKDDWDEQTDVNIGDTVNFKLTSAVPKLTGYTKYTYTVHDKMSDGLTFTYLSDPTSVVVKIGADTLTAGTDYTVVTPPALTDGDTFDIVFNPLIFFNTSGEPKYDAGTLIEITYSALLNEGAVIGSEGNSNKVKLDYSNNPYDEDSFEETPWDEVIVYTGEINVLKYAADGTAKKYLPGAEFELYRDETDTIITFVRTEIGGVVTYRVATDEEISDPDLPVYDPDATTPASPAKTTTLVSAADGSIKIEGLGASYIKSDGTTYDDFGKYYLVETKAPDGYNKLEGPVEITFIFDYATKTWKWTAKFHGGTVSEPSTGPIGILNQSGTIFPETGGIGRTIFYTLGLLLMVGAGAILLIRRRKTVANKEEL